MKQLKNIFNWKEISNINGFITEGVYNYAPKTPEECRTYFNSIGKKLNKMEILYYKVNLSQQNLLI